MTLYEKVACHILLACVFAAAFLNMLLLCKIGIKAWSLPVAYGLYCSGWGWWQWARFRVLPSRRQMLVAVLVPLAFLTVAVGLGRLYDTSWDGQDYQQSGVIMLHQGWNPWYQKDLPVRLPQSSNYVVGYPKMTWELQDAIWETTGNLQMATVTNVVAAVAAGLLAYGALRRLKLGKNWALAIALLATVQIHWLQQLPTFMQDGLSYELSLAAIAALLICMLADAPLLMLAGCISALFWLAGSKFSNLFVCLLLGLALGVLAVIMKLYRRAWCTLLTFAIVSGLVLIFTVPFGTNTLRFGSPVYPQNQPGASQKLLDDNLPTNIAKDNRLQLLFYGIFSHIEPGDAGSNTSPNNVARLKIPFTFALYEAGQQDNFQGRLGSGGLFFSGIVVLAAILFGLLWYSKKTPAQRRLLLGASLLVGLIIFAALFIPVANKLRYSPLMTLIPLIVLPMLVLARQRWWTRAGSLVLTFFIALNVGFAGAVFASARLHESEVITAQLASLQRTRRAYQVEARNLYSSYSRLEAYHIPFVVVKNLACPDTLDYTNWTTHICLLK